MTSTSNGALLSIESQFYPPMNTTDLKFLVRHIYELAMPATDTFSESSDWIYFLHIPKTAGTSFRYTLFEAFSAREIYPNNVDYYLRDGGKYLSWAEFREKRQQLFPSSKKCLVGHFQMMPILESLRDTAPRTICFLRSPVDRVISSIRYQQEPGRRYHGMQVDDVLSRYGSEEGEMQARFLGYLPGRNNIAQVLETLEQLDVICISEEFEKSVSLVNKEFELNLSSHRRLNRSPREQISKALSVSRTLIEEHCRVDTILYQHALRQFDIRCKSRGIQ